MSPTIVAEGIERLPRLLKVEVVARELSIGRTRAFDLIRSGEIESVMIGASRRVPREALDSYIEQLRTAS